MLELKDHLSAFSFCDVGCFSEAIADCITNSARFRHGTENHITSLSVESAQACVELFGEFLRRAPATPWEFGSCAQWSSEVDVSQFRWKHHSQTLSIVCFGCFGKPSGKLGERSFDQNQARTRRVVAKSNSRRGKGFAGGCVCENLLFQDFDWSGDLADLVCGDCAGAVDHHWVLVGVEDGGFDSVLRWSGVEDGVDLSVEIVEDVFSGGWADVAEDVCAGSCDRYFCLADQLESDRMSRHADSDERASCGDDVWNCVAARQEQCQRSWPEGAHEVRRNCGHVCNERIEHWILGYWSGDVDDDWVPRRPLFGVEDASHGGSVERIRSEAIDGFGGKGNQTSAAENLSSLSDGCSRFLFIEVFWIDP